MDGFPFDPGPKLRAEGFFGDQIDRPAEQVFQVELDAEVATGGRGAVERNEDVEIAGGGRFSPGGRSEKGEAQYAVSHGQRGFVLR